MAKAIGIGILIFIGLSITGLLPLVLYVILKIGIPVAIIYAIYRAVKALMDHNAELKRQREDKEWYDNWKNDQKNH